VPKSLPLRINGLKGTKKYVRLTFDPFVVNDVTIKLYGSLKDVTEEKLLELEIEQREQRYRFLFHNNPNPLMIVDDSGSETIIDVNHAATELYGYTKEEFVSMTTFDLRPPEDHEMFQNIVNSLSEKEKEGIKTIRTNHLKKNGELIIVDAHWKKISLGGERSRLILLIDNTEKAMFEQELIKTNSLLKTLIDLAPIGVVTVNKEGIVDKVWNAEAENIFGWTNEEADGNFLPYALRDKKREAQNNLKKVAETGRTELITIERETKKGKEIVLREYLTPIIGKDGKVEKIMLLIEDITNTIKVERALVDSEQKYRNLVEASHDLVWRIDIEGNFSFINNASSSILGYRPAEMIGNSFAPYINPSKVEETVSVHESVIKGDVFESFPLEMVTSVGELRHLSATAYPIVDDNGIIVGCSGTATDITYLKNYQSQLEESLAEKEILIKEIHHRVKNNLAVISGLFALQAMHVDKEDNETLTILQESQSRIKSIAAIHEKLYQNHVFSSIEIKSYLTDFVSEIAETYERNDKNIEIEVLGDEVSLNVNQAVPFGILANELIVNAYKYAFDGKDRGKINVSLNVVGKELIFCVADNGIGLAEDFDINELNSLGMTLIRTLAEQLNATFDWDTKTGEGVNFKVSFVPDTLIKSTWIKKKPENKIVSRLNKKR
ncbi:MAG: PAS domain S-box protein, partial [Balneola sp.]